LDIYFFFFFSFFIFIIIFIFSCFSHCCIQRFVGSLRLLWGDGSTR
jgi:hypothetical protein